jgi:hypothetical protein
MFIQRNIFLLDASGAATTAAVHLVLLSPNFAYVGVSQILLNTLGFIALGYCAFSWFSWLTWPEYNRAKLLIIAIANALFCATTLGIVLAYSATIPKVVMGYWVIEAAIILAMVSAELSILKKLEIEKAE